MTDVSERAREIFEHWFFRELNDAQRQWLIRMMLGEDIAAETRNQGRQRHALKMIFAAFERDILAGQSVGEGWVMVPREPTEAMLKAGRPAHDDYLTAKGTYPRTRAVWSAMLAATPAPDSPAMRTCTFCNGQGGFPDERGMCGMCDGAGMVKDATPDSPAMVGETDWRHKLWMVACYATGGGIPEIEGVDRPINDICVQISAHHNAIWKHAQESALRDQPTPASHTALTDAIDTLSGIAQPSAGVLSIDQAKALGVLIRYASTARSDGTDRPRSEIEAEYWKATAHLNAKSTAPDALRKALDERIANYSALRDQCVEAGTDENGYALAVEALERVRHDVFALATPAPSDRGEG